jgi:hypothetical protein
MAPVAGRPLLFLDVDGPLIPWGLPPGELPVYPGLFADDDSHPGLARIDPRQGRRLAALPCHLVWATAWEDEANEYVAPRLGLPPLPVVAWPFLSAAEEDRDERLGLHYKTRTLIKWAEGRPFAWVDDEITAVDRMWVAAHHPGPALLHPVDSRRGLAEDDFEILRAWLSATDIR